MNRAAPARRTLALMVGLLCLGMVSCAPAPVPTKEDIVGTWKYTPEDSTYSVKALDGKIEFKDDGTFQLEQIPGDIFTNNGPTTPTSENGTWEIMERLPGVNEPNVHISTSGSAVFPERHGADFSVRGSGESRLLVVVLNPDLNKTYALRKQ